MRTLTLKGWYGSDGTNKWTKLTVKGRGLVESIDSYGPVEYDKREVKRLHTWLGKVLAN